MEYFINENLNKETGIYRIRNTVNNKFYIGSTSNSFRHRFLQHTSDFKKNKNHMPALYRAFKKHGFENFVFELIEVCEKEKCIEREQFYLDKGTDYNSAPIAGSLLGYKHPETSKTKTVKGGNHHSAIPVDKYSKTGKFICSYNSVIEAQNDNSIKSASNIMQVCKGKVFSAGGFRWSFKGSILPEKPKRQRKHRVSLSKKGFYKEFESQAEAARFIGGKSCQGRIARSINKTKEKVYGFKIEKLCVKFS